MAIRMDSDPESLRRKLLEGLTGNWEEVVTIYAEEARAHSIVITKSGNTALHVAVASGQKAIVGKLVESITAKNPMEVLGMENGEGNNPLHLAAGMGSYSMCKCIVGERKQLLGTRNRAGDTPLLRAICYGKKEVFRWLFNECEGYNGGDYCRNVEDGKTALHLAIEGGNMDLALEIVVEQENLVHSVDKDGITPLHALAEKPTAFRSGVHFSLLNKIMYHCISVEDPMPRAPKEKKNLYQELRRIMKSPGKSKMGRDSENPKEQQGIKSHDHNSSNTGAQGPKPGIFLRFVLRVLLVITSVLPGSSSIEKLKEKKHMHVWSLQLMNKLVEHAEMNLNSYEPNRRGDSDERSEYKYFQRGEAVETPILVASRNDIVEMVEQILNRFPLTIYDTHKDDWKNLVLTAVENRQSHIYDFLLNASHLLDREIAFRVVDQKRNSALHHVGRLAGYRQLQHIPTSMLQMQWEVKWYQYVKDSLGQDFVVQRNRYEQTPDDVFQDEHRYLENESNQWLNSTSNSCSFIAALIATVAFASSASVLGGVNQETGVPIFEDRLAFSIFAMSSLAALCCSMISLLIFLAIFVSKGQDKDFTKNLPRNFLLGLSTVFISIAAMLICFCSGNFLIIKHQLKYAAVPAYAFTGLVMAYFVLKYFPLFLDLLKATFRKVPANIQGVYVDCFALDPNEELCCGPW